AHLSCHSTACSSIPRHTMTSRVLSFFFFPPRPPPSSTLFPYTTLFRSLFAGGRLPLRIFEQRYMTMAKVCLRDGTPSPSSCSARSEEHTSELQSLAYLVCRLLLEKKKQNKTLPLLHHDPRLTLLVHVPC